jgi:hypothetical protein
MLKSKMKVVYPTIILILIAIILCIFSYYVRISHPFISSMLLNLFGGFITGIAIFVLANFRNRKKIKIDLEINDINSLFSAYPSFKSKYDQYRKVYWRMTNNGLDQSMSSDLVYAAFELIEEINKMSDQVEMATISNRSLKKIIINKCNFHAENFKRDLKVIDDFINSNMNFSKDLDVTDVKFIYLCMYDLINMIKLIIKNLDRKRYELSHDKVIIDDSIL